MFLWSIESGGNLVTKQERPVEELADKIGKRRYSLISDNCFTKSVEFARRCTAMGLEAKVVSCLALFKLGVPVVGFRVTVVGPHFYTEVLGKRHEVSGKPNDEKGFRIAGDGEPKVLAKLGRFKFLI
jgi:hypothetical protein